MNPLLVVDLVLVSGVLVLGWSTLRATELFRGCVLFIAFGLVMALIWARLRAPDIALAEAAIGSGITGALLLGAIRRLQTPAIGRDPKEARTRGARTVGED